MVTKQIVTFFTQVEQTLDDKGNLIGTRLLKSFGKISGIDRKKKVQRELVTKESEQMEL